MRNQFDDQLELLNKELTEMGAHVIEAIENAVEALIEQNIDNAKRAAELEERIDEQEKEIEALCLKLLLKQQPVAKDLRQISAALKMITDLERIGDQAQDIGELVILMADKPYIKEPEHITQMARATIAMVKESIEAFVTKDVNLALRVCKRDDIVDELFVTVKSDLIDLIHKDIKTGEQAFDLLMVAKYFERIGDHAVNVAEWVIYSITGKSMKNKSSHMI